MSLVYIVYRDKDTGKNFVLMGKQGSEKKLAGKMIGFGGKCDPKENGEMETTEECARRELWEEFEKIQSLTLGGELKQAGYFTVGAEKKIDCFIVETSEKFENLKDSPEFVGLQWINVKNFSEHYKDMLEGDSVVVEAFVKYIETGETFGFEKIETEKLREETKKIYNNK